MGQASAAAAVLHAVRAAVELARLGTASDAQAGVLHAVLEPAQEACLRVIRRTTTTAEDTNFRNPVESPSRARIDLQAALQGNQIGAGWWYCLAAAPAPVCAGAGGGPAQGFHPVWRQGAGEEVGVTRLAAFPCAVSGCRPYGTCADSY